MRLNSFQVKTRCVPSSRVICTRFFLPFCSGSPICCIPGPAMCLIGDVMVTDGKPSA